LKLKYDDEPLSNFAFNFNLRRYRKDRSWSAATALRFTSDNVVATLHMESGSACTAAGTRGAGTLWAAFGSKDLGNEVGQCKLPPG
jgi:hypothetical protein